MPKATEKERIAIQQRYQAFIEEAKKLKAGQELKLLHHFSYAVLTQTRVEDFQASMAKFMNKAKAGQLDENDFSGVRSPGKVRLLLLSNALGSGAIPFVKGAEGWKLDDLKAACGQYDKDLNTSGVQPKSTPSSLSALATFQDPQASSLERTQAAIDLAEAKDGRTAQRFVDKESSPWTKTALLFAIWKSGGTCEAFASAFPLDGPQQKNLYDNDTTTYRVLLTGLTECAGSSQQLSPTLKVYRACQKVASGPRSEYVDLLVAMANKNPKMVLRAALKTRIAYEKDPVANILVGALHGEQKSPFYQHLKGIKKKRNRISKLAKKWFAKMAQRDEIEPPGSEKTY
jgi:hypothetical protein